jgi:PAS domain S-box-containing protein
MPDRHDSDHSPSFREALSHREQQLLDYAVRGYTDQAIANELGISLATVGTYWGRVRIKFGPYNRTELVALYLKEEAAVTLDLLREENKELVSQIAEHAKTMTILQTSLELFRGLVESAPDGILLVNQRGMIELANEQAEEMFGYSKDGLLGMSVETLIPERYHDQHLENRNEYNENPRKRRMGEHVATVAIRKNGEEFPIAAALSPTQTPGGILVTCIVRDLAGGTVSS